MRNRLFKIGLFVGGILIIIGFFYTLLGTIGVVQYNRIIAFYATSLGSFILALVFFISYVKLKQDEKEKYLWHLYIGTLFLIFGITKLVNFSRLRLILIGAGILLLCLFRIIQKNRRHPTKI